MKRVLIVDDDGHIREVLRFALTQAGYEVHEAKNGKEALPLAQKTTFDLMVLDIIMPESDGLDVCRELRKSSDLPIIFLSSRDDELDKILGLELGADDYLSKPFSPRELVARVKAVLRRKHLVPDQTATQILSHDELTLDLVKHRATRAGQEIVLTVTEFMLLQTLMEQPGRVFTRQQLVDRAYGTGHAISDRTVDSHIRRVRKKLGDDDAKLVETVYGLGYRLAEPHR